jgi:decaprenylphospho-beta-D-ribofuranose 2-oxidase
MSDRLSGLPRRVLEGFGYSVRADSLYAAPTDVGELRRLLGLAQEEAVPVAFRGSGRSYGDAALNRGGLVLDLRRMNRLISFDAEAGIVEAEPGFTIEDLWRATIGKGFWPRVVPGTMFPTLGGCAAMNIHGKNHRQVGGFGDAIQEAVLLTPAGEQITLSRECEPALFHAAISGFGMLGALTRIKLELKPISSGRLRVRQLPAASLARQFEIFEEHEDRCDYIVGWVDAIKGGRGLGRGQVHVAHHPAAGEDDGGLDVESQALPGSIMGVPNSLVGSVLGLFGHNPGMRFVNLGKYLSARVASTREYHQGHVAFHFLLDYAPGFRDAYRPGGLIQYQPFVPRDAAQRVFREIFERSQAADIVSYLGVMKRHRPDAFHFSPVLDGYSIALDFPVTRRNRAALWKLCGTLSDLVLEAGGRFYPAKDSVMRPEDFARSHGAAKLESFRALRRRCDPERVLESDFSRRIGLDAPA